MERLEAQNQVVAVRGDLPAAAAALDSLCAYRGAATSCATAMIAHDGMGAAVVAALSSADVADAAHAVIIRGGGDGKLEREVLQAAITALARSETQCAAHADHHEHCRLHAEVARETIASCEALLAGLG